MQNLAKQIERDLKRRIGKQGPPPSKPGRYPKKRTGAYHKGTFARVTRNGAVTTIEVGNSNVELSGYLERGTSKMAPRPHFEKLTRDWEDRIAEAMGQSVEES